MKINNFVIVSALWCILAALPALAAESLRFDNALPRSSIERIKSYSFNVLNHDIENLEIARIDLNGDGLDEFIARQKNCTQTGVCAYHVLAETPDGILPLGAFEGLNVLLGSEFSHGVRNLMVFKNTVNDYDFSLYTWHPETSAYRKAAR